MSPLNSNEIVSFFLGIAVLLGAARILGELALKFHQPVIVGEILGGILLGPAVLGAVSPGISTWLFPRSGTSSMVLEGLAALSVALLLLVAGLEIELSQAWRQARKALLTCVMGFLFPFLTGIAAMWSFPHFFAAARAGKDPLVFTLFFGTALTIAGLPVVAKTLMDLNLFKTNIGLLIMTSAMLLDLVGWTLFSVILGVDGGGSMSDGSVGRMIAMTLGFTVLMLTAGRRGIDFAVLWVRRNLTWPGGVLGFVLVLALVSAAATEAIGIHSLFGAFLAGIAIDDSRHLDDKTRDVIKQFVVCFFAPIYFALIGVKVNFLANLDLPLIATVLALGCLSKVVGNGLGAYWGGLGKREALAVGFGMNAGGVMQIIFATLAFQHGLIKENLLVAFVLLSLTTSLMSGPMITLLLGWKEPSLVLKPTTGACRQEGRPIEDV
jgi:Kef-type K+ transport system membrane component KefB